MPPRKVPYFFTDKKNGYVDGIFHGIVEGTDLFVIDENVFAADFVGPIPKGFVRGGTAYGWGERPFEEQVARSKLADWFIMLDKAAAERGETQEFWSENFIYPILGHVVPDPKVLTWGYKDTVPSDQISSKGADLATIESKN